MADISQITLPSGSTYNIKDAQARADIVTINNRIDTLSGIDALAFKGITDRALTDGGWEAPLVNNTEVSTNTLNVGDIYFFGEREYIWGPNPDYDSSITDTSNPNSHENVWHELGRLTGLGGLAYKNTASTAYTPAGTVTATFSGSQFTATGTATYKPTGTIVAPTFSGTTAHLTLSGTFTPGGTVTIETMSKTLGINVMSTTVDTGSYTPSGDVSTAPISLATAGSTTAINSASSRPVVSGLATTLPGADTSVTNEITYYNVADEVLSLYKIGCTKADSIDVSTVTVKTGDGAYQMNAAPSFTGNKVKITTDSFPLPTTALTFTGASATISVAGDYTPAGSITSPTFNGNTADINISVTGTPEGTITAGFTGTESTITVS